MILASLVLLQRDSIPSQNLDGAGNLSSLIYGGKKIRCKPVKASVLAILRLPAELIVLSACKTGVGKEIRGEGLISLTRGFMYDGAPLVMVTLWPVSDKATAELMAQFYKRMMGSHRMSPAAALRAAQIEVLKDRRWESPYFWAAFVLQGEWK